MIASGTCVGCRAWPGGFLNAATTQQPMIWALGPDVPLASNDVRVGLKKHVAYGHYLANTIQATGFGGTGAISNGGLDNNGLNSAGAVMVGGVNGVYRESDHSQLAHGIVMVVATLVLAPLDMIAAAVLARWPALHLAASALLFATTVVGFALGIKISALYIAVSGLRVFSFSFFSFFGWGIFLQVTETVEEGRGG